MVVDDILNKAAHSLAKGYRDLHHIVLADEQLEKSREEIEESLQLALEEAVNHMAALRVARGHKKEMRETQLDNLHTLANVITIVSNIEVIMERSPDFALRYFEVVNPDIFKIAFAKLSEERKKELTNEEI